MSEKLKTVLELKNVTKSYGKSRGIVDVNLKVVEGEVFGFLGPNGAGKSTAINTILDLLRPNSGTISVLGLDSHHDSVAVRERIGYLSGDMTTDLGLTGKQYLEFAKNLHGNVDQKNIDVLIQRLRCETDKKIKSLSRGNRQKIGLVAALMHDPELLILDEPTSGLDPLVQNEFNEIVRERKRSGKTTFMSSHVLSEVQAVCDRVGFIRDGKLIRVSGLEELLHDAPRQVSVRFASNAPDSQLKTLKGVDNMRANGPSRHFDYTGDYNELLRVLAAKPIRDLEILEPQLDELFREYYQSKEKLNV